MIRPDDGVSYWCPEHGEEDICFEFTEDYVEYGYSRGEGIMDAFGEIVDYESSDWESTDSSYDNFNIERVWCGICKRELDHLSPSDVEDMQDEYDEWEKEHGAWLIAKGGIAHVPAT